MEHKEAVCTDHGRTRAQAALAHAAYLVGALGPSFFNSNANLPTLPLPVHAWNRISVVLENKIAFKPILV